MVQGRVNDAKKILSPRLSRLRICRRKFESHCGSAKLLKGLIYRKAGSTRCYLTPYGFEGQPFSDPPPRPGFAALEPENPSSINHLLRVALHRVDQEIQNMLENARLPAKAA
jgi:hypothetical protein